MERLLKDAMKLSGRKFNLESLADIIEAIHIIQENMGITGTTAKEAEETISGSINMMKASWENLLTAFGDPEADLSARVDELVYSTKRVVGNLFPVFKRVLVNLWDSLTNAAANLPGLILGKNEQGEVNWPTWNDVKGAAIAAWDNIKLKASELAGLVFGTKLNGEVAWPTWKDVENAANRAWNDIKATAKTLAGLVLGTKEDGSVDWPTWDSVKQKAEKIWGEIKYRAKHVLSGIVYGTREDGSVDWPTWKDVEAKGLKAWNKIKAEAKKLAGFVFGTKEDGSVDWPTWEQVNTEATKAWLRIKKEAKKLAGLVFGRHENGEVDWPNWEDVKKTANDAWESIKAEALKLKGLVFGDAEDAASVFERIKEKWIELKTEIEGKIINISQAFFGSSDPESVKTTMEALLKVIDSIGVAIVTYYTVEKVKGLIDVIKNFKTFFNFSVGGNKVGLILSAIAAAITLIVENWDKIEPTVQAVGEWIDENLLQPMNAFVETIQTAVRGIGKFFGIDTSHWFGGEKNVPSDEITPGPVEYRTGHLDEEQIQSLINARNLAQQNPDALFKGDDDIVRNAMDGFVHIFESTLKAGGFTDEQIKRFSSGLTTLTDSGFAELLTVLRNAEGYYDESGQKVSGLSDSSSDAASSVASLANSAADAADALNLIDGLPSFGNSLPFSHAKGLFDVPFNNYLASLHRGEMVLTASQARQYREGKNGNFDLSALGDIVEEAISRGMSGVSVRSYLSGRDVTDDVNRNTVRQLKARRFAM